MRTQNTFKIALGLAFLLALGGVGSARAAAVNENFESYTTGSIIGQNPAWTGAAALVTNSPGGVDGHGQVLRVTDAETLVSFGLITDPVTTVEFDLYPESDQIRTLTFNQRQGGTDSAYITWAHADTLDKIRWVDRGTNESAVYNWSPNAWQHVVVKVNHVTDTFDLKIDGTDVAVGEGIWNPVTGTDKIGWSINDAQAGRFAYIDNLTVVPEPSSVTQLMLGLALVVGMARKR